MEKYDLKRAKEQYRSFCRDKVSMEIFLQPWYLDAACVNENDNWEVILVKEEERIVAAFPFGYKKSKGFWYIYNPFQVCRLNIWIDYGNRESDYKKNAYYCEIVTKILGLLPPYDRFQIAFSHEICNWTPFYQYGFEQTTCYSQIIKPMEWDIIWRNLQKYRRKEIKNAEKLYEIEEIDSFSKFFDFFESYYTKKGKKVSFKRRQLEALYEATKKTTLCWQQALFQKMVH